MILTSLSARHDGDIHITPTSRESHPNQAFQQAAYGFVLFMTILLATLIIIFLLMPVISFDAAVYASIITRKLHAKAPHVVDLSR
jgi:hypothetical protein